MTWRALLIGISTGALFLGVGIQQATASTLSRTVLKVEDINPDPNIFEAELSVDEQDVEIDGTTVHAIIYKDLNNTTSAYDGLPSGIPIQNM